MYFQNFHQLQTDEILGKHEGFDAIKSGLMFYNFISAEANRDLSNFDISKQYICRLRGKNQDRSHQYH